MYDKIFNIAVLAALGYLIVGDKVLPETEKLARATQATLEASIEPKRVQPAPAPVTPETIGARQSIPSPAASKIIPAELPEATPIGQPAPADQAGNVETKENAPMRAVAETAPQANPPATTRPRYQIAEGNSMMSSSDRHRQLQDLAENMELVFLDLRKE